MKITIRVFVLALVLMVSGCASLHDIVEEAGKPESYAKCAALDAASTALFLSATHMHEMNPIVNALHIKALGHVLGTVVPLIGLSYLVHLVLKEIDEPTLTAAAVVTSCGIGARNLLLMVR